MDFSELTKMVGNSIMRKEWDKKLVLHRAKQSKRYIFSSGFDIDFAIDSIDPVLLFPNAARNVASYEGQEIPDSAEHLLYRLGGNPKKIHC